MTRNTESEGTAKTTRQAAQCAERVAGEGSWGAFHMHQCSRNGKVQREGKWYCTIHDPVARKEKLNAAMEADRKKWDVDRQQREREKACIDACADIQNPAAIPNLIKAALEAVEASSRHSTREATDQAMNRAIRDLFKAYAALDSPVPEAQQTPAQTRENQNL